MASQPESEESQKNKNFQKNSQIKTSWEKLMNFIASSWKILTRLRKILTQESNNYNDQNEVKIDHLMQEIEDLKKNSKQKKPK